MVSSNKRIILSGVKRNFIIAPLFFACSSYPPGDAALEALKSSGSTTITTHKKWISFVPVEPTSDIGFVFYPGGKVEAEAYAPILRALADEGVPTYLLYLPRDIAILNGDAAEKVMDEIPMNGWVVSGHSLGGVTAAKMAYLDERIVGLSLWASYAVGKVELSDSSIIAQSISASEDTILSQERYEAGTDKLPNDTEWITIEGGNHAQFGDYGVQDGDGEATISPETQWGYTTDAVLSLFDRFN